MLFLRARMTCAGEIKDKDKATSLNADAATLSGAL
jgi:hypothetical protein